MTPTPRAIVEDIYARFGRGDIPGILALLAEDVAWTLHAPPPVPYGGRWAGRAAVGDWFALFGGAVEVLGFEVRRLVADGDTVVALGLERARARTTGRHFETPFAHVWTIREGEVASFEDHLDSAALVAAFLV